jgi:hypothetical protein
MMMLNVAADVISTLAKPRLLFQWTAIAEGQTGKPDEKSLDLIESCPFLNPDLT